MNKGGLQPKMESRNSFYFLEGDHRTANAGKTLTSLGVVLSFILATIGIKLGVSPSAAAIWVTGVATAMIAQYFQILESRGQMRKNAFYAI